MVNEKLNILKILIENKEKKFSIRKLSKLRKINYKSAYNAIEKLKEENIINLEKAGNTSLCSFNNNFNESVFLVEYKRKNQLLKNKNFKVLYNRLSKINQQFILLLFGSYVNKTHTKHSDIDLLSITDNKRLIEQELDLLPLKIHLTNITHKDFIVMLKTKELTVVSEAIKKSIILFGIEDYYRLLNNAE